MKFFVSTFFCIISLACYPNLLAGPMQMHTTENSAKIWLLFSKTKHVEAVLVNVTNVTDKKILLISSDTLASCKKQYPLSLEFTNLKANTEYELIVYFDQKKVDKKFIIKTLKSETVADFSFLTGSCAMQLPSFLDPFMRLSTTKIFNHMAKVPADFMLWLGDYTYYIPRDFKSEKGMWRRQIKTRKYKRLNTFLSSCPQYAVWDDHDYGSYDGDESFPLKEQSLNIHKTFWGNPSYGLPDVKGIFTSFKRHDCEFIILDDRYYRTKPNIQNGTMLGRKQLDWFLEKLKTSDAAFKFVIVGSRMLNTTCDDESYNQYPEEKKLILDFIKEHKIKGVLFITGDAHHSDLQKHEGIVSYPLYDFTCSPLTSFLQSPSHANKIANTRVPNTLTVKRNFGKISVSGLLGNRVCKIELFDDKARLLWNHEISEKELQ